MSRWKKFAVALTTATLLFGAQWRMWTNPSNRFHEHWDRLDAWGIVTALALTGIALFSARELLARHRRTRRVADHCFLLALGGGTISAFFGEADLRTEMLYLALAALVVWSWCRPQFAVPRRSGQLALIFSPAAAIMALQLLRYPEWSSPPEAPSSPRPASATAHPVFLFVFDEWSYARSTSCGELLPMFPNVRALAEGSFNFRNARSPGVRTTVSIPRLLWQRADTLKVEDARAVWSDGQPAATTPSLFSLAQAHGYNTALHGFYLPYRRLLGDRVDSCTSHPYYPKPESFAASVRAGLLRNVDLWHDPFSRRVNLALEHRIAPQSRETFSQHWAVLNHKLRQETTTVLTSSPPNTFALFHLPCPHGPWVFGEDGRFLGPYRGNRLSHDPAGYYRHLAWLDNMIGQFLGTLRRAGKFDDAMIIITSDHSWRPDYTFNGHLQDTPGLRHVPLFIKLPGQIEGKRIDGEFPLLSLGPVIEAVMKNDIETARAEILSEAVR